MQFTEAIDFFTQSLKYGEYDKELKVKAIFWRGEASYRLGNFDKAAKDYNDFILSPASFRLGEFKTAHYNMGYIYFKQKDYDVAGDWFRKYMNVAGSEKSQMTADALNRVGDCSYVNREFNTAISYYDKAIAMNIGTTDYAMYQKAFCLGLLKKHNEKINLLKQLVTAYPQSQYVDDAYYEIGRSYVALNNFPNAIQSYKAVNEKFPKSSLAIKSLLQLGLVYYNSGDLENSASFYKRVVNEYPGSPEAEDALLGIRNIYMDKSDPEGYIRYTNTLGNFAKTDVRVQDSLVFETAQRFYAKDDCARAVSQLETYIASFPDGRYIIEAHYYKADCQYAAQNYTEAVKSYEYLANRGRNNYTEEALARCGQIYFMMKNYESAIKYFGMLDEMAETDENRLEARIGLLRSQIMSGNNPDAIIMAANKVLWMPKLAPEIDREARFARAKSQKAKGNIDAALTDFRILGNNTMSKEGAEAKYTIIQYYFDQGNHPAAEKEVFAFADSGTSHQYWLARAFIVLADVYSARGENFQAEQYLKSLLENYEGNDDIHALANQRLNAIKGGQ
ncbi:MAG: tetratricopeptide repeat protein [Breznakibacter sp.]